MVCLYRGDSFEIKVDSVSNLPSHFSIVSIRLHTVFYLLIIDTIILSSYIIITEDPFRHPSTDLFEKWLNNRQC